MGIFGRLVMLIRANWHVLSVYEEIGIHQSENTGVHSSVVCEYIYESDVGLRKILRKYFKKTLVNRPNESELFIFKYTSLTQHKSVYREHFGTACIHGYSRIKRQKFDLLSSM